MPTSWLINPSLRLPANVSHGDGTWITHELRSLDLASLAPVADLGAELTAEERPLDFLINNASLYAATSPEAEGGGYYGPAGVFELTRSIKPARVPARALDDKVSSRLWDVSEQLAHVSFPAASTTSRR